VEIRYYDYLFNSYIPEYQSGYEHFPSYSVCNDRLINNYLELTKIFNVSTIEEMNVSKYLSLVENKMPPNMTCMTNEILLPDVINDECIDRKYLIMSLSNLGACYTFFSLLNNFSNDEIIKTEGHNRFIFLKMIRSGLTQNYKVLIHDRNQLPFDTFTEILGKFYLEFSTIKVKRLPSYDSNCFDYKKSESFKSRGHCINECLINEILQKYNCIPRGSEKLLAFYDNFSFNSTFCVNDEFRIENFNENECNEQCLKPCEESFFKIFRKFSIISQPNSNKYIMYVNNIYMTFTYFIISIGGLLGFWNNISIYDLQLILMRILRKTIDSKVIKILWKFLKL
jgi:hypothetical protein